MRALGYSCSHCEIAVNELEFACDVANPNAPISEFISHKRTIDQVPEDWL